MVRAEDGGDLTLTERAVVIQVELPEDLRLAHRGHVSEARRGKVYVCVCAVRARMGGVGHTVARLSSLKTA